MADFAGFLRRIGVVVKAERFRLDRRRYGRVADAAPGEVFARLLGFLERAVGDVVEFRFLAR